MSAPLPAEAALPELRRVLAAGPRAILEAPPGSGKTTRVPPALLAEPWLAGRRILMLEPRRLAARAAAERMAAERGERVGETVGYRVRFEACVSAATRIEVLTEGILVRMVQDDPGLEGVGLVILDEFHERHLASDLALALLLEVQAGLRPDLRLLVMSATLPGERLARFLDAPRLRAGGVPHPVEIRWRPPPRGDWLRALPTAVAEALAAGGDVLVFLPGRREIEAASRLLAARLGADVALLPLHGELSLTEQAAVLSPAPGRRRVILATNLAESSLTVPGVRAVVDTGLAREPRHDPASGLERLVTVRVSEASAAQRAGRAGREGPGLAIRLWPEGERLDPEIRPEIRHAELSGLALELAAWGSDTVPLLDPPPEAALARARELLGWLGALDEAGRITARGRALLATGLPPRLAAIARAAREPAERALAADLLALLEGPEPLAGESRRDPDLRLRHLALLAHREGRRVPDARRDRLAQIERLAAGWRMRLGVAAPPAAADPALLSRLAAAGHPDRIARADPGRPERFQLPSGIRAELPPGSALLGHPWLLALRLEGEAGRARIAAALALSEAEALAFAGTGLTEERRLEVAEGALRAERVRRLGSLVLARDPLPVAADADAAAALLAHVRERGLEALPWDEGYARLRRRLRLLARHRPELGPVPDEREWLPAAEGWLLPLLLGRTRLSQLDPRELLAALRRALPEAVRSALERELPERLPLPCGRARPVDYPEDGEPRLAARIQELFGLAETPRLLGGRLPVLLEILSPAGRPVQLTRDLGSFWREAYPRLRPGLRARYPRHAWPEDPLRPLPPAARR